MLPIRDRVPSRTFPFVMLAIIGANLVAWGIELALPAAELERFVRVFGLVPARYTDGIAWQLQTGLPPGDWVPFVTSMFLHGGWGHIILNMWVLWIFGDNVEDAMGHVRFLLFYLLTGIASAAVHLAMFPDSTIPIVGASGAIAGVMGAYLFLYPRARVLTVIPIFFWPFFVEVPAVIFLLLWFVGQALSGTLQKLGPGEAAGIAFWAHVGGFVAGAVLHPLFVRRSFRRSIGK